MASRLKEYLPEARILLVEAGPDTRKRTDILRPDTLNLGTDLDWNFPTEPSPTTDGRTFSYNAGKGLGGGSLINSCKSEAGKTKERSAKSPSWRIRQPAASLPCLAKQSGPFTYKTPTPFRWLAPGILQRVR